jgi:hypothetical protein
MKKCILLVLALWGFQFDRYVAAAEPQIGPPRGTRASLSPPSGSATDATRAISLVYMCPDSSFALRTKKGLVISKAQDKDTGADIWFAFNLAFDSQDDDYYVYKSAAKNIKFKFEKEPSNGSQYEVLFSSGTPDDFIHWEYATSRGPNIGDAP